MRTANTLIRLGGCHSIDGGVFLLQIGCGGRTSVCNLIQKTGGGDTCIALKVLTIM